MLSRVMRVSACAVFLCLLASTLVLAEDAPPAAADGAAPVQPNIVEREEDPIIPSTSVTGVAVPAEPHPYAILLAENSCKMRREFPGVRAFVNTDVPYYDNLLVKLTDGLPRLRFFKSKEDFQKNTVDPKEMTVAQMQELLRKLREDPTFNQPKESYIDVQLSQASDADDLRVLLDKMGVERGLTFAQGKVPEFRETEDEVRVNNKYKLDDVLADFRKEFPNAEDPTEGKKLEATPIIVPDDDDETGQSPAPKTEL